MSRNAKIIAGIAGALLLMCLCVAVVTIGVLGSLGVAVGRGVELSPVQVQAAANNIADFNLPPGYHPEAALDLGGFQFASYSPGDGHSHILFVQAPASANIDQVTLEQYAQQAAETRGYDRHTRTQVVGRQEATIRGKSVTLVVQEGTNSGGEAYRSLTGIFAGKGGPALLSVESPVSHWDQAEVDAFIASIH
jgi:hypothetical protein